MPSLHRRHRQDKNVLSCLVGSVNWVGNSHRQFSVVLNVQSCLWCERICDLTPVQFTPRTPTRQDSLVLSAVWTTHNTLQSLFQNSAMQTCILRAIDTMIDYNYRHLKWQTSAIHETNLHKSLSEFLYNLLVLLTESLDIAECLWELWQAWLKSDSSCFTLLRYHL